MPPPQVPILKLFRAAFRGPRLFRLHGHDGIPGKDYQPLSLENIGDSVVKWAKFCWSFAYWTSPMIITFLYRREYFTAEGLATLTSYATGFSFILVIAIIVRAGGRFMNGEYRTFIATLDEAISTASKENLRKLANYDFEFYAWPAEYRWDESRRDGRKKINAGRRRSSTQHRTVSEFLKALPCNLLCYVAAHTFGRRMMYPGATSLIQTLIAPALRQGRGSLIEEKEAVRAKLIAEDNNQIDTMFVDRRNKKDYPHGNTLVICCEGNSGFYEVGCMVTPLQAKYSVLGWNHPGFGGSTGIPLPEHEHAAIDVVMQYAIHRLGFQPYDIAIFAWSIGGYPATWAAMNYPDIRFVVLDATFDDILPLAQAKMPTSWNSLVITTIRNYLNLNNAEQLCKYPGPVLLIRRSNDEMITTVDPTVVSSNRGNDLLVKLMQFRYPNLLDDSTRPFIREYLSFTSNGQRKLLEAHNVEGGRCLISLTSYATENASTFPCYIGEGMSREDKIQLLLFLSSKYMEEYENNHCTPLPGHLFHEAWSL